MRQEGRDLAKALGLPRPRWLPIDGWGSGASKGERHSDDL
jgi:hypothetical protein